MKVRSSEGYLRGLLPKLKATDSLKERLMAGKYATPGPILMLVKAVPRDWPFLRTVNATSR